MSGTGGKIRTQLMMLFYDHAAGEKMSYMQRFFRDLLLAQQEDPLTPRQMEEVMWVAHLVYRVHMISFRGDISQTMREIDALLSDKNNRVHFKGVIMSGVGKKIRTRLMMLFHDHVTGEKMSYMECLFRDLSLTQQEDSLTPRQMEEVMRVARLVYKMHMLSFREDILRTMGEIDALLSDKNKRVH